MEKIFFLIILGKNFWMVLVNSEAPQYNTIELESFAVASLTKLKVVFKLQIQPVSKFPLLASNMQIVSK